MSRRCSRRTNRQASGSSTRVAPAATDATATARIATRLCHSAAWCRQRWRHRCLDQVLQHSRRPHSHTAATKASVTARGALYRGAWFGRQSLQVHVALLHERIQPNIAGRRGRASFRCGAPAVGEPTSAAVTTTFTARSAWRHHAGRIPSSHCSSDGRALSIDGVIGQVAR